MSKVDDNAAKMELTAVDNTAPAFTTVHANIDAFEKQLANLEKNLKPVQSIMSGGLALGGGIAGAGSLLKNSGSINGACNDLKERLLGIQDATGTVGSALQETFGSKVFGWISDVGVAITKTFGALKAGLEVMTAVRKGLQAAKILWITMKEVHAVASAAEVAAETANIAVTTTSTTVTTVNAAVTGAETKATVGNTVSKIANTASKVMNSAVTRTMAVASGIAAAAVGICTKSVTALTTATFANTGAKIKSTLATGATAVISGIAAAATWVYTAAVSAATIAVNFLTVALGCNPLTAWLILLTAAVAAVAAVAYGIFVLCTSMNDGAEATRKNAEEARRLREEHEKEREECTKYADRLELLQKKETLSENEKKESSAIIERLNSQYEGLNFTLDETTGKVIGGAEAFQKMKKAMAEIAVKDTEGELAAQQEYLAQLKADLAKAENSFWIGGEKKLREEIEKTEETIKDLNTKRITAANEITNIELEIQENRNKELEKQAQKQRELEQDASEFKKSIQETIHAENMNALEKELDALNKLVEAQREKLALAVSEGTISKEKYDREMEQIDAMKKEREAQIREKNQKEADQIAIKFNTEVATRKQKEAQQTEDEKIAKAAKENPAEIAATVNQKAERAAANVENMEEVIRVTIEAARENGIIDESEKEQIEILKQKYADAIAEKNRWDKHMQSVRTEIEKREQGVVDEKETKSDDKKNSPIDAVLENSTESYRKLLELQGDKLKSPEAEATEKQTDALLKQGQKQQRIAEETRDYTKKMVNEYQGV